MQKGAKNIALIGREPRWRQYSRYCTFGADKAGDLFIRLFPYHLDFAPIPPHRARPLPSGSGQEPAQGTAWVRSNVHHGLIVEDSPPIRRSLRAWFEERGGCEVSGEAENGAVAVERVKALNPDVVILDLSMPVINGLEAARKIASIAPKTAIVLFTMHASEHLAKEAQNAGIREVISKMDGPANLLASVENIAQKPRDQTE